MGHFLAVSAFRESGVNDVSDAVIEFMSGHEVESELSDPPGDEWDISRDALVFAPENGWTVVLWPEAFNIHDFATCLELSASLKKLVCSAHVYDDDYWAHGLFDSGEWIDRFCSMPDYFAESDADAKRLMAEWRGNPTLVAERLDVEPGRIAGYFAQFPAREPRKSFLSIFKRSPPSPPTGKVDPNDESEIDFFWVFTDFWRCFGIVYPDDMSLWKKRIRLHRKFSKRLPNLGEL